MFLSIDSFVQTWTHEAKSTQRMLDALTDQSLQQSVSEQDRTLARVAWHIVTSIHEMMSRTGLQFEGAHGTSVPTSAKEITESFTQSNDAFLAAVKEQWTDSSLLEECDMYGERWKNGMTLHILMVHMIHHRGQMTVLMRQAGLRVPGVYGPSREEWSEYGMEAPVV